MKKHRIALTLTILAFALTMYGCNKGSDGAVLAKVNRASITAPEFKKQIEDLTPQMQQAVVMDPKARAEFLEEFVVRDGAAGRGTGVGVRDGNPD